MTDEKAKALGAIEKREYRDWNVAFDFYLLSKDKDQNGCYQVLKYIPCLNGVGEWKKTMGCPSWVEQ